jgi:cytochrome c2
MKSKIRSSQFGIALTALLLVSFSLELPVFSQSVATRKEETTTEAGKRLFNASCLHCHSVGDSGGCLGPVLAGVSSRRTTQFLVSRISNSQDQINEFRRTYGHAELMPHMRVDPKDAKKIVAYLSILKNPENGFSVKAHKTRPGSSAKSKVEANGVAENGKRLVYEKGCLMCHAIGGMGGQFAPVFDGIARRRKAGYIAQKITNAELITGNSGSEYGARGLVMPPNSLNDREIADITSYLTTLK